MSERQQHRTVIRKGVNFSGRHVGTIAYCTTCGWESQPQQTTMAAENEGDYHVMAMS